MLALSCSITTIKNGGFQNVKAAADCLAAVNIARKAIEGHTKLTKCFQLIASLHSREKIAIRHVRAHPERRHKDTSEWSADDYGIYKADQLAGDDHAEVPTLDEEWVLQEITAAMEFRIVRVSDHTIFHQDLDNLISRTNLESYIQLRNTLRAKRTGEIDNRWSMNYMPLVGLLHDNSISTTAWATTLRLVWDKTWHGANQAKARKTTISTDRCRHCMGYEDQGHIILRCPKGIELRSKLNSRMQEQFTHTSRIDLLIQTYYKEALNNHTLWTGSLDSEAREFIGKTLMGITISPTEWTIWTSALRMIGKAARDLTIEHCLPCYEETDPLQENIDSFLAGSNKRKAKAANPRMKPRRKRRKHSQPRDGVG